MDQACGFSLLLKPQIVKYYWEIKNQSLRMNSSSNGQSHIEGMNQDWQTGKSTVVERAKHLLDSGLCVDCQFLVGANGSDQEVN